MSMTLPVLLSIAILLFTPAPGTAQPPPPQVGGEAHLVIPDLSQGTFVGVNGRTLLMGGLAICALGLLFGLITYMQLRDRPLHESMRELPDLLWETSNTYPLPHHTLLLIL